MIAHGNRILGHKDLGIDDDYEECVITRCGRQATLWKPSQVDGKLIPVCDKHYHDSSITPKRWENARKRREATIKEFMGKKCHICGKPATGWVDINIESAVDKYGDNIPGAYIPKCVWICGNC